MGHWDILPRLPPIPMLIQLSCSFIYIMNLQFSFLPPVNEYLSGLRSPHKYFACPENLLSYSNKIYLSSYPGISQTCVFLVLFLSLYTSAVYVL